MGAFKSCLAWWHRCTIFVLLMRKKCKLRGWHRSAYLTELQGPAWKMHEMGYSGEGLTGIKNTTKVKYLFHEAPQILRIDYGRETLWPAIVNEIDSFCQKWYVMQVKASALCALWRETESRFSMFLEARRECLTKNQAKKNLSEKVRREIWQGNQLLFDLRIRTGPEQRRIEGPPGSTMGRVKNKNQRDRKKYF